MGLWHQNLEQDSQELQSLFEFLLGTTNVYYNPPSSVRMRYDAIVFTRSRIENVHANNYVYNQNNRYEVTTITTDPDSPIIAKISALPLCSHERQFVSDNLYHNVFTLYH